MPFTRWPLATCPRFRSCLFEGEVVVFVCEQLKGLAVNAR